MIGEFHALLTLDSGEIKRIVIPERVQIPAGMSSTNLLADTAFLMAGLKYVSDLHRPKLQFKGGGRYTMSVISGHKILKVFPIDVEKDTTHAIIYMHLDEPYDPPTFVSTVLYQCSNRPNAHTPSAFTWRLRYGCKCTSILKHTQANVEGLHIRQGTLADLPQLLPCSACLAGKLRKTRDQPDKNYTDIENLNNTIANLPLSWTASTADKNFTPNRTVSIDWGIINKKSQAGKNNVFALFLDLNTGYCYLYLSRRKLRTSRPCTSSLHTKIWQT